MTTRQQEGIRIADVGPDDAEIARGVEQAGIPAFPVRQSSLDFVTKSHECNVTEHPGQDNNGSVVQQAQSNQAGRQQSGSQQEQRKLRNRGGWSAQNILRHKGDKSRQYFDQTSQRLE
jgi:hypothetical protein